MCTCGITTPQGQFLYESMRTCDKPDTDVTLYYTYNWPLISYDHSINVTLAKGYSKAPYLFHALDLEYLRHEPYLTSNGSLHMRLKRHSPDDKYHMKALEAQSFPLSEAIRKMETKEPTYIGSFFPMNLPLNAEEPHEDAVYMEFATYVIKTKVEKTLLDPVNTPVPNFIFNVVTLINALVHCCLLILLKLSSIMDGGLMEYLQIWFKQQCYNNQLKLSNSFLSQSQLLPHTFWIFLFNGPPSLLP